MPSFFGGIHPPARKEYTRRKALGVPERGAETLIFPLLSCRSLVRVGEEVTAGQPIAEPLDQEGVYQHCGVSGRVAAIEPRVCLNGEIRDAIVVENDFRGTPCPRTRSPSRLSWPCCGCTG